MPFRPESNVGQKYCWESAAKKSIWHILCFKLTFPKLLLTWDEPPPAHTQHITSPQRLVTRVCEGWGTRRPNHCETVFQNSKTHCFVSIISTSAFIAYCYIVLNHMIMFQWYIEGDNSCFSHEGGCPDPLSLCHSNITVWVMFAKIHSYQPF